MRARLQRDLMGAIAARDAPAISALRSALSALGNAEAVDISSVDIRSVDSSPMSAPSVGSGSVDGPPGRQPSVSSQPYAGSVVGLGAGEVERRRVTDAQVRNILSAEVEERLTAATTYDAIGQGRRADRLRAEAEVLSRYVPAAD